ncbi:hypothetical protein CISIN_1g011420mg [Citrus sinensis]|uniref:Uncharacterized protein n=1 Tax=Citrus sinensis TaxID=2711 RepID=A0A067DYY1_CITSI|nr:hypothetical protein CISIN_1g011420mg [Citrus sinensis]KDO48058.1 hypothetical protein CISIN_1g011420mg [Citrus sinensis]
MIYIRGGAGESGLDSFTTQGEDDLKLEVLDGLLDDIDEVDDFHAANDLSTVCDDFLLDIEFTEKVAKFDCGPVEGSHLGNSSSESHSPGASGSNVAVGMSDSSITALESECKNDSLEKMVNCELHGTFKSKCEYQAPDMEKCPSSHDMDRFDELDSDDNVLLSSILSKCKKRVKSTVLGTKVKRLRKPTKRYIEESSDLKPGSLMRGQNVSTATLKDKHPKVTPCNGSSKGSQVASESWLRGGRLKKRSPILGFESDDDIFSSDSDDDRVRKRKSKIDDRRKNQRMWTLSEVMKLIDGISQFGVGKWTDIKRLLFSSSSHRTPIDLRDKWRNLLRASYAHQKNKGEVDPKHAMRSLPKPVLCRIRELATIHPYPRVPYSKKCNGDTDSSRHPIKAKSAPFSSHGRNLRTTIKEQ